MGGAILTLRGKTVSEVERILQDRLIEADNLGLYEDRRTEPLFDEESQEWMIILRVVK